MSAHCCPAEGQGSCVARGRLGRTKATAGFGGPALVLALLPKCPMCVAAYIALATGLEISIGVASWLRAAVIVVCVLTLALLALRTIRPQRMAR